MSLLDSQSIEILDLYSRSLIMKEFAVTMHGGDMLRWPAKILDAFIILCEEAAHVESLRMSREKPRQEKQQRRKEK